MKKLLPKIMMACASIAISSEAVAQLQPYVGPRLLVESPAAVAGAKNFTYSADPDYAGPWGADLTATYVHVPLKLSAPNDACAAVTAPTSANAWALIWRGTCEFGAKALAAQTAGYKGVIIVNNISGAAPIQMGAGAQGAGVTIPALMISNTDGVALKAQIDAGDSVFISLSPWGFGLSHDLGFAKNYVGVPPLQAIPYTQMGSGNGNPKAYKSINAALIANTGTSGETGVKQRLDVNWTPTAGSPSNVHSDSITLGSTFNTIDSVNQLLASTAFDLHATSTGTFDYKYTLKGDSTDGLMSDNIATKTMYVTPGTFCKSTYDNTAKAPVTNISYSLTTPAIMTWGPMIYVAKGGYKVKNIQSAVNDGDTTKHGLDASGSTNGFFTVLFKWKDTMVANGVPEPSEMVLVASGNHTFTNMDSNFHVFTSDYNTNYLSANLTDPIVLEDNTWYWPAAVLPANLNLCADINNSYYARNIGMSNLATGSFRDYWQAMYMNGVDGPPTNLLSGAGSGTDTMSMYPYATIKATSYMVPDSMAISFFDATPAIALNIDEHPVAVPTVQASKDNTISVYPNPAVGETNVKINLPVAEENVTIYIMSQLGQVVYSEQRKNVKTEEMKLPLKNLAAGNYYVMAVTKAHTYMKPLTVNSSK